MPLQRCPHHTTRCREALLTLLDGLERDLAFASRELLLAREAARQRLDA